jgi:HNH endonuclease/NUMOD4 motif
MEEWRAIPGYPRYEASSEGRIRHVRHEPVTPTRCRRQSDYPRVQMQLNGRQRKVNVHLLVARAFIGECPPGYVHNHKDGNKQNARPSNLEFVTRSENEQHKYKVLGCKANQGSKHGMARTNETDVIAIRTRRAAGESVPTLAKAFGMSQSSIYLMIQRRTWRHV